MPVRVPRGDGLVSDGTPLSWRARQWWEGMPRTQRVNRLLYGLALVTMLGLLAELGLGDSPVTDVDVASSPRATNPRNTTTTRSPAPTVPALRDTPGVPGGMSLADILAQITAPSIPDAAGGAGAGGTGAGGTGAGGTGGGTPARATATTSPSSGLQPSGGGGGGGGGSPAATSPATTQAPSNPATTQPPDTSPPDTTPPSSTPSSQPTQTTRTTVPRTVPTFPDISIPTITTTCGRRCP